MRSRPVSAWIRAPVRARTYRRLWRLSRIYPAPWTRAFRDPDFTLARLALRRGAAQKVRELAELLTLLRGERPRALVEIGTNRGGTLFALCRVAESDAMVISIDLPGGDFGGGYAESEVPRLESYARPGQELHLIRRDSHEYQTRQALLAILKAVPIDFLLIDGDHSYEGVKRDFELYEPLVREGGIIAFHDILPHRHDPRCQVDRFWREIQHRFDHLEIIDSYDNQGIDSEWGGLGVLRKAASPNAPQG